MKTHLDQSLTCGCFKDIRPRCEWCTVGGHETAGHWELNPLTERPCYSWRMQNNVVHLGHWDFNSAWIDVVALVLCSDPLILRHEFEVAGKRRFNTLKKP